MCGFNCVVDGGLVVTVDFGAFFDAVALYKTIYSKCTIVENKFVVYNLLAYVNNAELAVRKSVTSVL